MINRFCQKVYDARLHMKTASQIIFHSSLCFPLLRRKKKNARNFLEFGKKEKLKNTNKGKCLCKSCTIHAIYHPCFNILRGIKKHKLALMTLKVKVTACLSLMSVIIKRNSHLILRLCGILWIPRSTIADYKGKEGFYLLKSNSMEVHLNWIKIHSVIVDSWF